MNETVAETWLVRHGETQWSASGRHTGRSDIPLTTVGEAAARGLAARLVGQTFAAVWSSPSQRARRTCELAGFGDRCIVKDDLAEWDYGAYEGLTTPQILQERPGWLLFRDGRPDGEQATDAGRRADSIVADLRAENGAVLIFSSAHFLRVLAARWLGLSPEQGALFVLDTASISVLGYEHHSRAEPVVRGWNRR